MSRRELVRISLYLSHFPQGGKFGLADVADAIKVVNVKAFGGMLLVIMCFQALLQCRFVQDISQV